jgi:hypothetical protein
MMKAVQRRIRVSNWDAEEGIGRSVVVFRFGSRFGPVGSLSSKEGESDHEAWMTLQRAGLVKVLIQSSAKTIILSRG